MKEIEISHSDIQFVVLSNKILELYIQTQSNRLHSPRHDV